MNSEERVKLNIESLKSKVKELVETSTEDIKISIWLGKFKVSHKIQVIDNFLEDCGYPTKYNDKWIYKDRTYSAIYTSKRSTTELSFLESVPEDPKYLNDYDRRILKEREND